MPDDSPSMGPIVLSLAIHMILIEHILNEILSIGQMQQL
jgi:hypothetical protein